MTHPFENYELPPISEVFTEDFKTHLLGRKVTGIANSVYTHLTREDNFDRLASGVAPLEFSVDTEPWVEIGIAPDGVYAAEQIIKAISAGLKASSNSTGIRANIGILTLADDDEDPKVICFQIDAHEKDDDDDDIGNDITVETEL